MRRICLGGFARHSQEGASGGKTQIVDASRNALLATPVAAAPAMTARATAVGAVLSSPRAILALHHFA